MNIFFDARWTRLDTHDGISRYGSELVGALAKLHPVTMIIHDTRQLKLLPQGVPHVVLNNPMSPAELFIAHKLNRLGADIVFSPLQVMGSWGRKYKLILTLQDMIYYKHPKPPTILPPPVRFMWWLFHKAYWPQRLMLNRADFVATVSETSKQEILTAKLTKRPMGVVYNASPALRHITPLPHPKKELIYMGSFMPYKNVELLVRAMKFLPDYKLHLASRIEPSQEAALKELANDATRLKFWRGISDDDYAAVLARATASVTASKSEGFGLPIIEALTQGVPVICTDMPIFREVGGDAALYFNPNSPEDFAARVRQLEDTRFRQEQIKRGRAQAANFSWERSAKQLLEIISKL